MTSHGALGVLPDHDIIHHCLQSHPSQSMPIGGGRMCVMHYLPGDAMVWQVNHTDYWRPRPPDAKDQPHYGARPVGLGRFKLRCEDGLIACPAEIEQRLHMDKGEIRVSARRPGREVDLRAFCPFGRDLAVMHFQHRSDRPKVLTIELSGWRHTHRAERRDGMIVLAEPPAPMRSEEEIQYLRKIMGVYDSPVAGMAMAVAVEGADTSRAVVFEERNRIQMKLPLPAEAELVFYLAAELSDDEARSVSEACSRAAEAKAGGREKLRSENLRHWEEYWSRSYVRLESADAAAGYIEHLWYLHMYLMGISSAGQYAPKFNGGPFLYDGDFRYWGGGYWHFNQRHMHGSLFAANRLEGAANYFQGVTDSLPVFEACARDLWGHEGAFIHESRGPDGAPYGHDRDRITSGNYEYTGLIFSTGLEIAYQMLRYARFLGDEAYLREKVYPVMRGAVEFIAHRFTKNENGRYEVYPSNAHETFWHVRNPQTDLAGLRACVPALLELSERFGLDEDRRALWRDLLENLADYPRGKLRLAGSPWFHPEIAEIDTAVDVYAPCEFVDNREVRNRHPVDTWTIHPFELSHPRSDDYERAVRTFRERLFPQITASLSPDFLAAAMLRLPHEAHRLLESYCEQCPVMSGGLFAPFDSVFNTRERPVTEESTEASPEPGGHIAEGVNLMMLQGHNGLLVTFPALPETWDGAFRLRAEGPVMVEAERRDGFVVCLAVECLADQTVRMENPFGSEAEILCDGQVIARSSEAVLTWRGRGGECYRVLAAGRKDTAAEPFPTRQPRQEPRRWRQRALGLERCV